MAAINKIKGGQTNMFDINKEIACVLVAQDEKTLPILKAGMKAARKVALEA